MTTNARSGNLPSLTGIRGVAALLVVLFHMPLQRLFGGTPQLIADGYYGVDLFFILSGFILMHVHEADFRSIDARGLESFYTLRFFRVYPLHFIVLMLILAWTFTHPAFVAWVRAIPGEEDSYTFWGFFQTLTLTNRVGLRDLGQWNIPSWSLSSEMVGYVVLPFLGFMLLRVRSKWFCIGYAVAALLAYALIKIFIKDIGVLRMALCFPAGAALCRAFHLIGDFRRPSFLALLSLTLAVVCLCFKEIAPFAILGFGGLIFALAFGRGSVNTLISSPPVMFLGKISFSLYLTHSVLLLTISWLGIDQTSSALGSIAVFSGTLVFLLAIATFTYHAIEAPSHRLGREIIRRMRLSPLHAGLKREVSL